MILVSLLTLNMIAVVMPLPGIIKGRPRRKAAPGFDTPSSLTVSRKGKKQRRTVIWIESQAAVISHRRTRADLI